MAVKKAEKKVAAPKAAKKEAAPKAPKKEVFFAGVGRRKTSVAQVRIFKDEKATDAEITINDKKFKDYFPVATYQTEVLSPFKVTGTHGQFRMSVVVRGGGFNGQIEAVRLGLSRALVKFDETLKKALRDNGMLTRDSRAVERKKPGLKKARRAPQWAKR